MSGLSEAERGALEVALNTGETLVVVLPGGPLASAVEAILAAHVAERDALAARVEAGLALAREWRSLAAAADRGKFAKRERWMGALRARAAELEAVLEPEPEDFDPSSVLRQAVMNAALGGTGGGDRG